MILDAIAVVVLCGMMAIPLINIVVGLIAGACLGGPAGALVGVALAVLIIVIEKRIAGQLGRLEPNATTAEAARPASATVTLLHLHLHTQPQDEHDALWAQASPVTAALTRRLRTKYSGPAALTHACQGSAATNAATKVKRRQQPRQGPAIAQATAHAGW